VASDPYRYFRVEARDLLDQLSRGALDLERAGDASEATGRLLRLAHTLKGAARVVGQREISEQAHAVEDLLAPLRHAGGPAPRETTDALLRALDTIEDQVRTLSPAPRASPDPGGSPPAAVEDLRTVRADVAEMDALLDGLAEARAGLNGLRQGFEALGRARRAAGDGALAADAGVALADFTRGAGRSLERLDRELRQARSAAERLRLIPAGALFNSLERTARDIAVAQGKEVSFEGRDGGVRLDAHLLGAIQAPLVQLVRNAAAHGVEMAAHRRAAGKPPTGRIVLEVARRGRRIAFICRDDGAGVRVDELRQAALRKGLVQRGEAEGPEGLTRLLLRGGLSTSGAITEVSGRGIGLELVREAAERLGGEVAIQTETGVGTSVELLVPLSTASIEVLLAETLAGPMAIPLDAVGRVLRVAPAAIARTAQSTSLLCDGTSIPFVPLSDLLGAPVARSDDRPWTAVVVETDAGTAALGVERLLGVINAVLRPLPDLAPATPLVAGILTDDDGAPQLVLDPDGLVASAQSCGATPNGAKTAERSLLVIDDSLTTRMLEQSILELAGYRVDTASSAEEGLQRAQQAPYALFLVDVEMPGMDGFAFIETIRRDPEIRDVPALLITSCNSPEARLRGEQVGAQGYIVKSEFDQTEFLRTVEQLVRS